MRLKKRGVHIALFSGALLMSALSACCMAQDDVDDVMKAGRAEILANPLTKENIGRIVRMDIAHVEEPFLYPQQFSTWYSETNLFLSQTRYPFFHWKLIRIFQFHFREFYLIRFFMVTMEM